MGRKNRATLKEFFRRGSLPNEEHFHDLIDSSLNMNDEGFSKSQEHGLEILSQSSRSSLLSFFRYEDPGRPLWRIALDPVDRRHLHFREQEAGEAQGEGEGVEGSREPILSLGPGGRVGINTGTPESALDVRGFIRSKGREGVVQKLPREEQGGTPGSEKGGAVIVADGGWKTIAGPFHGCHALEVVAGVGLRRSGRYALLHAIAINAYHPTGFFFDLFRRKKPIRVTQAYHRHRSDRLSLRWADGPGGYLLQLRTRRDYGEGPRGKPVRIRYHLTELWSDHGMSGSWDSEEA